MANICFDCQRALPLRGCPWADKFEPVEGWTATPVTIKTNISHRDSYNITACPLFLQDKPKTVEIEEPVKKTHVLQFTSDGERCVAEYSSVEEAAKVFGVSVWSIYRMLKTPLEKDDYILKKVIRYEKSK